MERIAILGCGWLGMPLGTALAQRGYVVNGATTTQSKTTTIAHHGMTPYLINLTPELMASDMAFFDADVLIINIPPSNRAPYLEQMSQLVRAIEAFCIKKVLFVSATSVYPLNNNVVTEQDATRIVSPHSSVVWWDVEQLFTNNRHFTTTIVRFSGLIGGDYQPGRHMSGRTIDGGSNPINVIHQDDCVAILCATIEQNRFGEVFNASSDEHPSKREFYTAACQQLRLAPPVFTDKPAPYRVVNCDHLKQTLGYRFIHPDPMAWLGSQ